MVSTLMQAKGSDGFTCLFFTRLAGPADSAPAGAGPHVRELPGNGELVDSVGEAVRLELDLVQAGRQRESGNALVEGTVDDLEFDPGELLAHALVDAVPESVVLAGLPVQVQLLGLGEGRRVPVGEGQRYDDAFTRADGHITDFDVLQCDAAQPVVGNG